MRKPILLFVFMFLFIGNTLIVAQTATEIAIKQVCEKDTEAYLKRDFDTWKSVWHQVDHASMLITGSGYNYQGWAAILAGMKGFYESNPTSSRQTFSHDNHVFNIQGEHAFVSFEQTVTSTFTVGGQSSKSKTYEARNMIKVNGEWKLYNQVTSPMRQEKKAENVNDHLRLASLMLNQLGRTAEAAEITEMIADFYPNLPNGYWGMGYYAFVQKDKVNALKHLEKAMSLFDSEVPSDLKGLYETVKNYQPDGLIFMREIQLKEGQADTYTKNWQKWRNILEEKKVPKLYWDSGISDENIVYHNYVIQSLSDFDKIKAAVPHARNVVTESMGKEEMAKWTAQLEAATEGYKEYVVRRVTDLSYWPSGDNGLKDADIGFFNIYRLEFDLAKEAEHLAFAKDIKAFAKAMKTPVPFNYFEYVLGGSAANVIIVEYAKDKADYERRHAEEEKLFDTEKGRSLYQRMEALYGSVKPVQGKVTPEISRPKSMK